MVTEKINPDSQPTSSFIKDIKFSTIDLSEKILLADCEFNLSNYNQNIFQQLNIKLPDNIKNSVFKRQAEFLAGRYVANKVLEILGFKHNNIAIGKHRNPVWPKGISASISHTGSQAICVATNKHIYQYLGIDLENRISSKCIEQIKNSIINANEYSLLLKSRLNFNDAFTLTFSAKESLFKALYPSVGYYFDFSAAQITEINLCDNSFSLILLQNLSSKLITNMLFTGYYNLDENSVRTVIYQ